jgi:uncharacterized Ntn-hydrolase superfamily protein
MTCSIVARCPRTNQFGVAATTAVPAVGKLLTHAAPNAGAIATQARLNPYLGIDGMRFLEQGYSARETLDRLIASDPRAQARQVAVLDGNAGTAVWTGNECLDWAGSIERAGFSVQGNRLAGPEVLDAMVSAFMKKPEASLDERFIETLEAAIAAGGDREGEISATIFIMDTEEYPLWDIRADHHTNPVKELRRLHTVFAEEVLPEIRAMPTRAEPGGSETEHQT